MPQVPFISQTYEHRSRDVSSKRTLNLYPELTDGEGKTDQILIGTPGTRLITDLSGEFTTQTKSCRGLHYTSTGRFFVAYGDKVFEVYRNGLYDFRFSIGSLTSKVSFADNGRYMVLADGQNFFYWDLDGDVLATFTIEGSYFENPTMVKYKNNRFVAINNSNNFFWTDLGISGSLTWGATNIATAEQSADDIISMEVRQGEIWFFGPRSYEVWSDSANPDLPFQLRGGSATEVGCGATYSTSTISDQIFWLGSSRAGQNQVFMSQGYGAKRISNHAIEYLLTKNVDITSDAVGFTYQQEGHIFYVLTLISANKTLVYDLTSGQWHERATRRENTNILDRWSPLFAAYAFEKVFVGSTLGALILELDLDKYDEWDSRPIQRIHQSPVYWEDLRLVQHKRFDLDMETGVGLQTGQGSDPEAMLQFSDDGGFTWSSELWTKIGKIGKYGTRCSWRRLGMSRERVYRVTISDPVKVVMIGARVIASGGTNP